VDVDRGGLQERELLGQTQGKPPHSQQAGLPVELHADAAQVFRHIQSRALACGPDADLSVDLYSLSPIKTVGRHKGDNELL
jgi:hypothetical protein